MHAHDEKSDGVERVKLRRQKADDKTDEGDNDEKPDTINIPKLESEESAAQRRSQRRQGLKILTPQ